MATKDNVHGEGNYEASRKYNEATKKFVESGRVEQAARDAAPASDADALQMTAAEAEGKRHAREEDPALSRKATKSRRQPSDNDTPETAPEDRVAPMPGEQE